MYHNHTFSTNADLHTDPVDHPYTNGIVYNKNYSSIEAFNIFNHFKFESEVITKATPLLKYILITASLLPYLALCASTGDVLFSMFAGLGFGFF